MFSNCFLRKKARFVLYWVCVCLMGKGRKGKGDLNVSGNPRDSKEVDKKSNAIDLEVLASTGIHECTG